ncbi:gp436 family protein [Otariodibacter oris]|uniref:Phage gp36-like protein n=1 Tax=Otariodibacter oris TaxID=1032623 RepID=A0A420XIJ1_9PAST|nr:DUF1320 domain-containing protein [Otariodibacter oris]QGM81676.1 hypothetical protein A6A10_04230 [Otariodibacter oris]RKR77175.1 phage gp36-like protein [Otariodibacter oris]
MNYATPEDFLLRIGEQEAIELTDRERLGVVDSGILAMALGDASSQIDGYLVGRYSLPLNSTPSILTRICCDIARYYLTSMSGVTITEEVIERYKFCLKELENIAKGLVALGVEGNKGEDDLENNDSDDAVQFANGGSRIWARERR